MHNSITATSATLLGYNDFYTSGEPTVRLELAKSIGADTIRDFISLFMTRQYLTGLPDADQLLAELFTYFDHSYLNSPSYTVFSERLKHLSAREPGIRMKLISPEALLHMFLWLRQHQEQIPQSGIVNDASSPLNLFEFLLQFNDEITAKLAKARASAQQLQDNLTPYREVLAIGFPAHDFNNIELWELLQGQFYKGAKLLLFMENTPNYKGVHQETLKDFGVSSNRELLEAVGGIILGALNTEGSYTTIVIPQNSDYQRNVDLFEKLALQHNNDQANYDEDYRELRASPIFKVKEGEYRAISPVFLVQKIYQGLIFHCSGLAKNRAGAYGNTKGFLGDIRKDFSEGELLYELADSLFDKSKFDTYDGQQMQTIIDREPDFYATSADISVVLENKDILIAGEKKLSYDFPETMNALTDKNRFDKAALQLATNAVRALSGELPLHAGAKPNSFNVAPVLTVHSSLYSCPAFNFWINHFFDEHLAKFKADLKYQPLDFSKIMPVTVVEIDTMLAHEEFFAKAQPFVDALKTFQNIVRMRQIPRNFAFRKIHALGQLPFSKYVSDKSRRLGLEPNLDRLDTYLFKLGIA